MGLAPEFPVGLIQHPDSRCSQAGEADQDDAQEQVNFQIHSNAGGAFLLMIRRFDARRALERILCACARYGKQPQ
jgi:hypothetical protein